MSRKGAGFFKRRKQVKSLNQMFTSVMADVRIFEQRQDYKGAVIASFGGLANIAGGLLSMNRAPYETGREFGFAVANRANISAEVMDEYLTSFEIARYTDTEITYDDYQEAIQRLDICFRGIREQGVEIVEPARKQTKKPDKKRKKIKAKA
ncbi:MAG: DUF4129 domain-containing protein [Candidatus Heimdallarchaeota archaeon]|nr:DUF4129 domain-containing protein [Candidatus Heimdallarchaeota archaeon]MCK4954775.1 DUF4129 domain-containing protein [Candidatus Heimdallarchaeota archaeon]